MQGSQATTPSRLEKTAVTGSETAGQSVQPDLQFGVILVVASVRKAKRDLAQLPHMQTAPMQTAKQYRSWQLPGCA